MNNSECLEHRYFCDSILSDSVEKVLDSLGILARVSYSLPITETIYFTYGEITNYEMPVGLRVRLRRYMATLSEVIKISGDVVLLEVKKNDRRSGMNVKAQVSMPGIDAIKALTGKDDCLNVKQQLGINTKSQLLPTGATQSYRCHWIHQSGMRVTLDKEIKFFLFKENLYVARIVATLGEGKLEFKFPKANGRNEILEREIISSCGCTKRPSNYVKRRAKECITVYINKKTKH